MQTKGNAHPGDHVHYAIDGGKARIILAALVTPSEVMENTPMLDLLWHSRFRWHLWPHHVTGDTRYGTWHNIAAVEQEGIHAYVPLKDYETRSPYFPKSAFIYEAERDVHVCPQGQSLRRVSSLRAIRVVRYIGWPKTCNACPVKAQCTPGKSGRKIERSFAEEYIERVRGYHQTEDYQKAMRKRQVWIEPLFGEAKQWHGLRRFRLRRLAKVNSEMLLVASGQNIKRLLNRERYGHYPHPDGMAGAGYGGFSIGQRCRYRQTKRSKIRTGSPPTVCCLGLFNDLAHRATLAGKSLAADQTASAHTRLQEPVRGLDPLHG
jgi:hypothetical protein